MQFAQIMKRWIKENTDYKPVISNVKLGQTRKRRREIRQLHDIPLAEYLGFETTTTFKRHYLVGPNTRS